MAHVLPCLARHAGKITVNALTLFWGGIALFGIGFLHTQEKIGQIDARCFHFLYKFLNETFKVALFQRLWFLGRTPLTLACLAILTFCDWERGLVAWGVYGLAASLERGIKFLVKRPRPFASFPENVTLLQPQRPSDFSFPSGDSLRVWFLALVIPSFWEFSWPVYALSAGIALTVTLGRVAMGVHYPLDTISGTGLGILGAGLMIFVWQVGGLL
ncbi:MAG: hypothetical protein DRI56_08350 [Chloroflexota bacterium]|nr:MAG: hypothetical protein DRI56_08350 [Chloroflexota bacterium]